jgi:hypothetical protein
MRRYHVPPDIGLHLLKKLRARQTIPQGME